MTFSDVEKAREAYHKKTQKGWRYTAIATIIAAALGCIFFPVTGLFSIIPVCFFAFFALIIGIIIIALTTREEAEAYRKSYKSYFVEQNLRKTFTDLSYDHQKGLDKSLLRYTGMVNTGDAYVSNDLTVARYRTTKFIQADATIQEAHTDSEGNTTYTIIFRGRFMFFEFPKKFDYKLELIGKIDRLAARYGYKVLLGFIDNTLLVALDDGKDSFEPPKANKPIDESAELAKINTDIRVITDFVDEIIAH